MSSESSWRRAIDTRQNKELVRRLVDEVVNKRNPAALDQVASGTLARIARRWISPFRQPFPDFRMNIIDLIAEDKTWFRAVLVLTEVSCASGEARICPTA